MAAVGLIHEHRPAPLLQALNQWSRIIGIALVSGMHQHRGADAGVPAGEVVEHSLQPIRIGGLGLAPLAAKGQVKQQRVELAQQAGLNQAAVGVAGQQHALAGAAEAE